MEPAMAVNILTSIKDKGHRLKNHMMKNFTNALYSLQKDKKKIQRVISTKIINHIKKNFHMQYLRIQMLWN